MKSFPHLQCFMESVSQRELGEPTSRAEISSQNSIPLKAAKGAQLGAAQLFHLKTIFFFETLSDCFIFRVKHDHLNGNKYHKTHLLLEHI